jgi:hypothetical protein
VAKESNGLHVSRDGVELGEGSLGAALPVDPGPHTIVVSGVGYADRPFSLTLAEGETRELVVNPGAKVPVPVLPGSVSTWNRQKTAAVVSAGAGAVGIIVGSIFGVLTIVEKNASGCPNNVCSTGALGEHDTAYQFGNVSTVAFVVGGVGLATGAVLWFTAPKAKAPSRGMGLVSAPEIGFGPAGVLVRGAFE